jgi:hypothetical protein
MSKKTVSTAQVEIDSPAGEVGGPLCPPYGGMVMGRGHGGGAGGHLGHTRRRPRPRRPPLSLSTFFSLPPPPRQVFAKVAGVKAWNSWRTIFSRLIATGGGPTLAVGDTFVTAAPLLLGFIPVPVVHTVTRLAPGQEVTYSATTLFGAVTGSRTVAVHKAGGLLGRRAAVTVTSEVAGPGAPLIPGPVLERSNVRFLLDLAAATEVKAA